MKRNISILLLALIISAFLGCQEQPDATFIASVTTTQTYDTITFKNQTTNASSYEWEFGDGMTSTEKSPVHFYATPGKYTVMLTAYSGSKKKYSNASQSIMVKESTGKISFWQDGTPAYGITTVTVGDSSKQITMDFPDGMDGCETPGCANFKLNVGTYTFTATDSIHVWNDKFTITKNNCLQFCLN